MAIDGTNELSQTGGPVEPAARQDVDRAEIKRLAEQFEAMLMTQMLREMRRSMVDEDKDDDGFGAGPLTDTADVELGNALSRAGGVGLTDALLKAFERQILGQQKAGRAGEAGTAGEANVAGLAGGAGTVAPTLPADLSSMAPISSPYGWRQDPLTGASRFHQGVDLAVAYGRDVKAAAEGTVSFAGTQKGYGQTVVVDHAGGRQTRYAHLSEPIVRPGDHVVEGQVLGRSGSSGRSTGPHLHFELLVDGRPVDPAALTE